MKEVNSISGGKTSSYMAIHYPTDINIFACVCIDYHKAIPKDKAVLQYALNKLDGNFIATAEHEKTLKIVMDLEQLLGKNIIWVRGKSFDEIIDNAGCLPTWARRFCTTDMKILPMFEYLYPRYGITKQNIGFRYDEWERAFIIKKDKSPVKKTTGVMSYPISCNNFGERRQNWDHEIVWQEKNYPLIDNIVFHRDIKAFWDKQPNFDFPLDSNCRGCHHKPKELIKQNWIETPEVLEWFALQEEKKKLRNSKFHTFNDDGTTYREIFNMNFPYKLDFDFTMCNSGSCTD